MIKQLRARKNPQNQQFPFPPGVPPIFFVDRTNIFSQPNLNDFTRNQRFHNQFLIPYFATSDPKDIHLNARQPRLATVAPGFVILLF